MGIDTLASLYLGGVAPGVLTRAGRIVEERAGAVAELARMVRQDALPRNAVGF
jgi:hypothetical protein